MHSPNSDEKILKCFWGGLDTVEFGSMTLRKKLDRGSGNLGTSLAFFDSQSEFQFIWEPAIRLTEYSINE